jgi:hypothetical protein
VIFSKEGYITLDQKGVFFKVARLSFDLFEDESFQYCFEPYYDVLDAFPSLEIPGIDLSLREPFYYRSNMTPVFILERSVPKNRIGLKEELKTMKLDFFQPFLMVLDSPRVYGGDRLSLKGEGFFQKEMPKIAETNDLYKTISHHLKKLASRTDFFIGNLHIDATNRTILIQNYLHLFEKVSHYYDEKSKKGIGRKKQTISYVVLEEIHKQYSHGVIPIDKAVEKSGLGSKRTFYRRVSEWKGKTSKS